MCALLIKSVLRQQFVKRWRSRMEALPFAGRFVLTLLKIITLKFLYLLVGAWMLQSCKAQSIQLPLNPDDNSLLWEISGNGLKKPSYLFGTFHILCKQDVHFSETLKKALTASEEVYFEMDLDDPSNTLGGMFFMNMKDGKTLKDLYNDDEYTKVEQFFNDSLKMPLFALQKMKPLVLQTMLYPRLLSCKQSSGVEMELLKLVAEQKKEIKGFETIQDQAAFFDDIPYETQAKELLKSLDSLDYWSAEFDNMVAVYKAQKLSDIEKMFTDSEFTAGENKAILLDNRNRNWVEQLSKIMPKTSVFVAVGAGHLPGEMGVIELLRKAGYTVRPLQNND